MLDFERRRGEKQTSRNSGDGKKAEQGQAASRRRTHLELSQKEETCLTAKMVQFSDQDDDDSASERLVFC